LTYQEFVEEKYNILSVYAKVRNEQFAEGNLLRTLMLK